MFEPLQIVAKRRQTAAGGDDGLGALREFSHNALFQFAKSWLAILRKNISNRAAGAGLDQFVGINKLKTQMLGDHATNGGLAHAHETDERDVGEMSFAVHEISFKFQVSGFKFSYYNFNVNLPPLILASTSPRRAELLSLLPLKFAVIASDATEVAHGFLTPLEVCQLNAHRKARAVAKHHPDALVLGADTLVFLDGQIYGKPRSLAEAERMIARLQGRTHQVVTGVSLIHLRKHQEKIFAVSTDVLFHPLTRAQIKNYLSKINPLDKAGAYAIQERGELIIAEIAGSFSNVVGLPVERLREELSSWPD